MKYFDLDKFIIKDTEEGNCIAIDSEEMMLTALEYIYVYNDLYPKTVSLNDTSYLLVGYASDGKVSVGVDKYSTGYSVRGRGIPRGKFYYNRYEVVERVLDIIKELNV